MMNVNADEEHVNGYRIGVQWQSPSSAYAANYLPNAEVYEYDTIDIAVEALKQGDVDFVLGYLATLKFYEADDENLDVVNTFDHEEFGIGVAPGESDLLAAIDVALGEVIDSGEYDEIFATTFGDEIIVLTDDTTEYTATEYPVEPSGALAAALDAGTIAFGADPYYPPFESYDDDGNWVGFDVDMADAIATRIGAAYDNSDFTATMVEKTWDELLAFGYDNYDATLSAMIKTEERAENTDFSRSYYSSAQGILVTEGSPTITWVDDLNDFICDSGEIIPPEWVNDGDNDCGDWSDEDDGYFVCDNGEMIPEYYVNDGYDDCGDGSDEEEGDYFVCDNGETIPMDWYDDGWDDCGDGSDEPNGVDSGDDEDDELGFGFPTGQLGMLLDEMEESGHEETLVITFVTPQMAEVEVTSRFDMDEEMSDTLREDIILATIMADVEAYFVEGKPEIEATYASGDVDVEETLEAYVSLYENATASAVPGYSMEDADIFEGFNTVESIREQTEFDDMEITQSHLDTYYDVAWGNGMNNMLTMDMTLTFVFYLALIAAFSGEEVDEEQLNATMETMVRSSVTDCPESLDGFGVLSCVMEKLDVASMELFGGNMFEDESDADDFDDYCLDNDNMMLKEAGGGCSSSDTGVFYNANEDDMGMTMDGMNSIDAIGLMTEPGGFPLLWPEMTAFVNTENILGVFSENAGKEATIEIGMTIMVFFPGVETGDSHMFAFEPKEDEAPNVQVSPPAGYSLENDPDSMTWNFTKSGDLGEEVDESGLPGPGLLVILLTILGVASVRRRF